MIVQNSERTTMKTKVNPGLESSHAQQCYRLLQEEIINGTLKPGEKLKTEPLKERLSIGQSPIREALSRLVTSGLVVATDNKGFRVAEISEADIRDIYRTFTAIENLALRWAIEQGDEAWEAGIVAELYKLSLIEKGDTVIDYNLWVERNYAFHYALIAGCKSPNLLALRTIIYTKFDRYCRMAYNHIKTKLCVNYDAHKTLVDAILARDIEKACTLMTHHINEPLEMIIQTLKESELI